jgi:hypothetical protein
MWGIFKNLSCLVSILKRIAQKLKSSFKRRTKSMIATRDMTGSHLKENSIVSGEQLESRESPHSDMILRRGISCPTITTQQTAQILKNGNIILQQENSLANPIIPKETTQNGKKHQKNFRTTASAQKEEEADTERASNARKTMSNALTIGLIGAKVASFFFAVQSFIGEENTEDVDIDTDI